MIEEYHNETPGNIVKTVRHLKEKNIQITKTPSINDNSSIAPNSNDTFRKRNPNSSVDDSFIQSKLQKRMTADSKTTNGSINTLKPNINISMNSQQEHIKKFSVDGNNNMSNMIKPGTSNTTKKEYKPYDYYNFKKLRKAKTEYQKNLMSNANIQEYKIMLNYSLN